MGFRRFLGASVGNRRFLGALGAFHRVSGVVLGISEKFSDDDIDFDIRGEFKSSVRGSQG